MTTDALTQKLTDLSPKSDKPIIVAVSGYGGSGKSTLSAKLSATLGDTVVVPIDDFIIGPRDQRSGDWQTFDRKRLRREVLETARIGKALRYQANNSGEWVSGQGGKWTTIVPHRYLIIEGCGILHPLLMPYYDYSVWIDCSGETAWGQAKQRDKSEGHESDKLWDEVWVPNDQDFFNTYHPDKLASGIVQP